MTGERLEEAMLTPGYEVLSVRIRDRGWEKSRETCRPPGPGERRSVLMLCCAGLLAHRALESTFGKARNYLRDLPHLQRDLCSTSLYITMVASIPCQILLGPWDWTEERNHSNIFC